MIILIIMLLFAISVDLFIMWRIYKAVNKNVDQAVDYINGFKADLEYAADLHDSFNDVMSRIKRLERKVGYRKEKRVQDLPFPEDEEPTDDYWQHFDPDD